MKFPIFVVGVMVASVASAMLKGSPYFSDNGVVQCDMKARVFGVARPASKVTVEFKGQKKTAVTGSDWRWTAELDPLKADAKGATMTITDGKKTIIVTNLLVGEVWSVKYGNADVGKKSKVSSDRWRQDCRSGS